MNFLTLWLIIATITVIILCIELGFQIGRIHRFRGIRERLGSSSIEASVFGLMGLLIAFTFYGAGSRFDNRRNLIVKESNAIGTAYLRLYLLPADTRHQLQEDFRNYVRSRLNVYRQIPDIPATRKALGESEQLQRQIWKRAVDASRMSPPPVQMLLLASLNEMIDITTDRTVALTTHPPAAVFLMLAVSAVVSSLIAGYSMSASGFRDWVMIASFAVLLTAISYVIIDYEFPRAGTIQISPVDQLLVDKLNEMK
jgi:hypothetical protein